MEKNNIEHTFHVSVYEGQLLTWQLPYAATRKNSTI